MSVPEVTIIDYGVGNLLSVKRGFEHCGAKVIMTANPDEILRASLVVLPGVGAFGNAMQALKTLGLIQVIQELAEIGTPLLGICLGMQLLLEESSEFGKNKGLGLIPGEVIPIPHQSKVGHIQKIPHIGWSKLHPSSPSLNWEASLLKNVSPGEAVYFVHSYMALPEDLNSRVADCSYGGHSISAVIEKNNIYGCQFHPEKSGEVGLKILRSFIYQ